MNRFTVFSLVLFQSLHICAQPRTIQQVQALVTEYVKAYNIEHVFAKVISEMPNTDNKLYANKSENPYYILEDTISSAFIIVSGDERMKDILGYCETCTWNKNRIPDGLQYLLNTYREQYELLQNGDIVENKGHFTYSIADVEPLLSTEWSQESPYNDLCPSNCPSGCVATAMAQVMKYHSYPEHGEGSFSYISETRKFNCSYNYSSATFEWDKMKNTYSVYGTSEGRTEVANIMYACGVSVGMNYNYDGSGALICDVPYALIHYFGYNHNVHYLNRNYYLAEEWYQTLCNELAANRPVIYGGFDTKSYNGGGHAFIIEGSRASDKKFYVNWGWGGDFDGYYELDALDPATYRFSANQQMIINVSPQPVGKFQDIFYAQNFTASSRVELNKQITYTLTEATCYSNLSSYIVNNNAFNGTIGVGVFDENFNFIKSIDSKPVEGMNTGYYFPKLTFAGKLTKNTIPQNGKYYIAPYVQSRTAKEPTRIRTFEGQTDHISLVIDGDNIDEDDNPDEEPSETNIAWNEDFENLGIPAEWIQKSIEGDGTWNVRSVILPSERTPNAASGRNYAFLNYNNTHLLSFDSRTITQLQTNTIHLEDDNKYNLSLHTLKYTTNNNTTDVLSVYYKQGEEWILLKDIEVINQVDWNKTIISLPVSGSIQLAFEGNLSRGSSIFLDDIRIFEKDSSTDIPTTEIEDVNTISDLYTISGIYVGIINKNGKLLNGMNIPKGVYIIRSSTGEAKSVFIK